MIDIAALREVSTGPVLSRDDGGFAEEVASWKTNVIHSPDVAVGAATSADVVEAVRFALDNGLTVQVQATGHGNDVVTSGILVTTRRLDAVSVDAETRIATIGAGVQWSKVVAAAAEKGLATVPGSGASVGVVGYLSGGGLGPLARSHGFSSDYVIGFSVVDGRGELVSASTDENADLFWALRGGKTGLGIVTEVRVTLVELPELYAGSLVFDAPQIDAAYRAWADYTTTASNEVTTSAMILRAPDIDEMPPQLRGRTLLIIRFAAPLGTVAGERLAAPLRAAAPVYIDQLGPLAAGDIAQIHNDPTQPTAAWGLGRLLSSIDQRFVTALLSQVGAGTQSPLIGVEIRHLGGATETDVAGGSAVGGRASGFTLQAIGAPNPDLFESVLPVAGSALLDAIAEWVSPETNINFAGNIESQAHFDSAWPPAIRDQLDAVRTAHDPRGIFVHGFSPAGA